MTFKTGDQIVATSKHNPELVVAGKVTYAWTEAVVIKPQGHLNSIELPTEDWTIELAKPVVTFGPGAVVRSPGGSIRIRLNQDRWFHENGDTENDLDATLSEFDDYYTIESYGVGGGVE